MRKIISIIMYVGAAIFIGLGFHRMFAYQNYDPSEYPALAKGNINAHVGGDAYNFIINGTHATAFFVLAGVLCIVASALLIIDQLKGMNLQ